jgi:Protein of unknown function (DUF3631)
MISPFSYFIVATAASRDEDIGVTLLVDIRRVFDSAPSVDRYSSATLVTALCEMEGEPWSEFRGVKDDVSPHRLTQGELARRLAEFGIKPKTVWPLERHAKGASSSRGYLRSQFEDAWRSYCDEPEAEAKALKQEATA